MGISTKTIQIKKNIKSISYKDQIWNTFFFTWLGYSLSSCRLKLLIERGFYMNSAAGNLFKEWEFPHVWFLKYAFNSKFMAYNV